MTQAERFLHLYNQLDKHLREHTGLTARSNSGFGFVVQKAAERDRAVAAYERRLREFAELRNAIVHESRYAPDVIAEPLERAVDDFERIAWAIMSPPRVDAIGSPNPQVFLPSDALGTLLGHLKDGDFSQAVVRHDSGDLGILSSERITRWLEHHRPIGILELDGVLVSAALPFEPPGTFHVMRRDQTIYDARTQLQTPPKHMGARLAALLVTQNGRSTEIPLRIITPWDLLVVDA